MVQGHMESSSKIEVKSRYGLRNCTSDFRGGFIKRLHIEVDIEVELIIAICNDKLFLRMAIGHSEVLMRH